MKFLCLLYYDADKFASLSTTELETIGPRCAPHDAALKATGRVATIGSLTLPDKWFHIMPKDGRPDVRNGQYLKRPDQAGAFLIVDARDVDEAIAVASKHAAANVGEELGFAVEVLPCETFETYAVSAGDMA